MYFFPKSGKYTQPWTVLLDMRFSVLSYLSECFFFFIWCTSLFGSACLPYAELPALPLLFTRLWRKCCIFYSCWFPRVFEVPVVCNSVLSLSTNRRRQHPGAFLFSWLFLLFSLEKYFPVTSLSMKTLETQWRKLMQDETSPRQCTAHSIPCLGGKEEVWT